MIIRLSLTNFMAHADTVLELGPGLNVLTGPNNTGKSAVVEALRCLAQNPPPRHVIRHGAGEARVSVTLSDGTEVAWVRRPKYALYELTRPGAGEPETFAKFGRTPPEAICDALRLDLVALEVGEPVDVHIGNQREPVFLLGESGTTVAGFFAASSEAAHLVAMQQRLTERARKAKIEGKRLDARLEALAAELDRLAPLPELEYRLAAGEMFEERLCGLEREIPALERLLASRRSMLVRLEALARTGQALAGLAVPPGLAPCAPLAGWLDGWRRLVRAGRRLAGRGRVLAGLVVPPALADTPALAGHCQDMERGLRTERRLAARGTVLGRLAGPPPLADTAGLAAALGRLAATRQALARLADRTGRLAPLAPPPRLDAVAPLAGQLAALARLRAAVASREQALARATAALEAGEARIAARLAALGACPLCGARLLPETFLGHEHGQGQRLPGEAS